MWKFKNLRIHKKAILLQTAKIGIHDFQGISQRKTISYDSMHLRASCLKNVAMLVCKCILWHYLIRDNLVVVGGLLKAKFVGLISNFKFSL